MTRHFNFLPLLPLLKWISCDGTLSTFIFHFNACIFLLTRHHDALAAKTTLAWRPVYVIHFISWHMSKSWKKNLFEKRLVLTSGFSILLLKVDIRKGPWLSLSFGALAFNRLNSTVCWIDLDLSCSSRSRENVSSLLGRVIGCNVKASLIQ